MTTATPAQTRPTVAKPRTWNAYKIRRRLIPTQAGAGLIGATVKSFTRDDETRWHPTIDAQTFACHCDCPDYEIRHARGNPTAYSEPEKMCKHARRLVALKRRQGLIPAQCCCKCGTATSDAFYEVVNARGEVIPATFICRECAAPPRINLADFPDI